jgi:hypothetical protein
MNAFSFFSDRLKRGGISIWHGTRKTELMCKFFSFWNTLLRKSGRWDAV